MTEAKYQSRLCDKDTKENVTLLDLPKVSDLSKSAKPSVDFTLIQVKIEGNDSIIGDEFNGRQNVNGNNASKEFSVHSANIWKMPIKIRNDILSKIKLFDEKITRRKVIEKDPNQIRIEKLKCMPSLDNHLRMRSEAWRESHKTQYQDDFALNYNNSFIFKTGYTIKAADFNYFRKKRCKHEKRARKEGRLEMKRANIKHLNSSFALKFNPPQVQQNKEYININDTNEQIVSYKPSSPTLLLPPGADSGISFMEIDDSIIIDEQLTEMEKQKRQMIEFDALCNSIDADMKLKKNTILDVSDIPLYSNNVIRNVKRSAENEMHKATKISKPKQAANEEDHYAIFNTLGLDVKKDRSLLKRIHYTEHAGLSIEHQQYFNTHPRILKEEAEMEENKIIPQYGNIPISNFILPSNHPYDGLYWPIFQPFDAIKIDDDQTLANCDVQNQMVNQTVCNYAARKYLLCDDYTGIWDTDYKEGHCLRNNKNSNSKPGRFRNRVCYARKVPKANESIKEARERERLESIEFTKNLQEQQESQRKVWLEGHNVKDGEVAGANLEEYNNNCLSTKLPVQLRYASKDIYSEVNKHSTRTPGKRRKNPYNPYWFRVSWRYYVPANDRRSFLCKYINYFNRFIVRRSPDNDDFEKLSRWIGASFTAAFANQADEEVIYGENSDKKLMKNKFYRLTFDQLRKGNDRIRLIETKYFRGSKQKIKDLEEICQMQDWEWEHWPQIWDSLSSIYRSMPPVSQLVPIMEKELDKSFAKVARINNRERYHKKYTEVKEKYLENSKRMEAEALNRERR